MTFYCEGFRKNQRENFVYVEDRTPVFIHPESQKLIVGTMISYQGRFLKNSATPIKREFDFFYPNVAKNKLWHFLGKTFVYTGELENENRQVKERFLKDSNVNLGMVNLIASGFCKPGSSNDRDIVIEWPKEVVERQSLKMRSSRPRFFMITGDRNSSK